MKVEAERKRGQNRNFEGLQKEQYRQQVGSFSFLLPIPSSHRPLCNFPHALSVTNSSPLSLRDRERIFIHGTTMAASDNPNPDLPSKTREEGELSSSDDDGDDGNVDSSAVQSPLAAVSGSVICVNQEHFDSSAVQSPSAAVSGSVPSVQKSAQGAQGGSSNTQLQTTKQPTAQKILRKDQLPPKSSLWTGHVGTDKNLVISFSDDDSGSDLETKANASRMDGGVKQPSSSLEKPIKLQQNAWSLHKQLPKRASLSRTFNSSMTKIPGSNSKGAGSTSLPQGMRARTFNPMKKNLANQERGRDQVVSNNNKLQDLRHQIALRESELKLKAAQQNKEYASVLGRDHNAMNSKNNTARKHTPVSSGPAQLEPKEPNRKRLKLGTSHSTLLVVGDHQVQGVPPVKSILPLKDSTPLNYHPQERKRVDHSQIEVPICRGDSTVLISQRESDKHLDNSLQNMPQRSKDGDVNYDRNQTEKNNGQVDPCVVAYNQNAVPANMGSTGVPKKFEALSEGILSNHNGHVNVSEPSGVDLQSFFSIEESIDKELEEAQEHRYKCEIEERNALKAYLKAQRSLLEANAQCTSLYHKRELYSAKLRSLILSNSGLSWSSGQHQHPDIGLDYLPRLGYEIPTSSRQKQAEYNDINNPSFDSNNRGINNTHSNTSNHHVSGANLGSEPCGEPDASTSEPPPQRDNYATDGAYSPSDEIYASANENEEISPAGHVSNLCDSEYHRKQDSKARQVEVDTASNTKFSTDSPQDQDSLLLEATLRSELFARLGARAMKSSNTFNNVEPASEQGAENEVGNENTQVHLSVAQLSGVEDDDLRGIESHERSIYVDSSEIQNQHIIGGNFSNVNGSVDSGPQEDMCLDHCSMRTVNTLPVVFRSAFSELRGMFPFNSNQLQSKNTFIHANVGQNENATSLNSDETKWNNMSMAVTIGNLLLEDSSYGCSPAVDPFWPLCMYELRGKCNNDECPWQHAKDYGDGNIQHSDSNTADCQGRLPLHQSNCNVVAKEPKCHQATILPTYLVGLDILKADQFAYKSVVAHRNTPCWQKHFSNTLATSNVLRNVLPVNDSLLRGGNERIEVHGAWNKQLSSFHWRSGAGNQIKQAMADSEQAVEMALLILNQEMNKLQGVRKALSVLSKALETDPTSVVVWVVYLLIYYGNLKPNEKDDMFFCAVRLCGESYVLWLMYINSRGKLDDRLDAYDTALSVLCQHTSANPKDGIYESACILDLFLQMMDCLCMSGSVGKAIERSYGIFHATKSNESHHLSLSDIPNYLTISDKCVFWVCCIYLVIYRKLPDAVVQKFECEKDLLDIDWPFVSLSEDDKEMANKVVETAVESIDSYVYNESIKSDVNLRSAQLFALNHIRCMVALDNKECSRNLLDKYVKLYPSCIELVLASVRIQKQGTCLNSFMGFEDAISRWPKEIPGIQCIWNQYIENAIHNQRIDVAKAVTVRWFHSIWQVQDLPNGAMETTDGAKYTSSLGFDSKSVQDRSSLDNRQIDMMFGFLNLSLYYIFKNDRTAACIAIDKARSTASFGALEQCMRKHVMFLVCDALSLKEDGPDGATKKILELYMDGSSQALLVPKVLTRKFIDNIKKPRVQNLIGNILGPFSFDSSLLNLILQSWFGSSLLPQTVSDPKHLVDFVEDIMDVVPHNFHLAINVCKLLIKDYTPSDLNSASLWFWACSTLVNAILDAMPVPPEYVWVEASGILQNARGIEAISERFYRRALSVYPFSIMLQKCFYKLDMTSGDPEDHVKAGNERGIELD
ncbi:hypothetical protein RJT34_18612 [Clitoria ternatea]|uniref:Putative zinc-finger domain-containing protein n=1 Tax=Clitoria ternatea TaxID=43366 RepID=A0AAN9PEQ1_CLITE